MFTLADTYLLNTLFAILEINLSSTITEDGRLVAYDKKTNSFIEGKDLFKTALAFARGKRNYPDCFYSLVSAIRKRSEMIS